MSVVTGLIICMSVCEEDGSQGEDGPPLMLERINLWLMARSPLFELRALDDHCGGNKHPQMCIAGAGLNYFPENDFLEWFKELRWVCPENVVLIMQPEDGPTLVWRPEHRDSTGGNP